jgi:glutathione synthase/RimK-type ligase-like ATP-grasp enzyme
LKSIGNGSIWDEEKKLEYVFYTSKIESASLADVPEEAFIQTVSFVQNYIEKLFELRITVVKDRIFACKIDSQILDEDKGKIDWRQGYDYGLKHEIYDLPQQIKDQCLMFLQRLGLNFGCFDFVVTPTGEYVFLECNPNGQWLWIELETGMKISEAISEVLVNKK